MGGNSIVLMSVTTPVSQSGIQQLPGQFITKHPVLPVVYFLLRQAIYFMSVLIPPTNYEDIIRSPIPYPLKCDLIWNAGHYIGVEPTEHHRDLRENAH